MRIGTVLDFGPPFDELADQTVDFESAGLDSVTLGEAYSFDAVSQLGYLAARTSRVELATGILALDSRTPTTLAMTAAGLDYVSNGRFRLGLGASGPQVVEGFHGVPFGHALGKTRETIEICRTVWRREPLRHNGRHHQVPLPADRGTGLGKPLKLINHPVRADIPISIAALGDRMVELAAETAQGWEPIFFHPEKMDEVWGEALRRGAAKRPEHLGNLDIIVRVRFAVTEDPAPWLDRARPQLALYVGGMGSRERNFYNDLACRYGFADQARRIQDLFLSGQHARAAAAVPDELVRATTLIGPVSYIAERLSLLREVGVGLLNVAPLAGTHAERLAAFETLRSLLD
ncbi:MULTISPECIES: LLM class F420-dependent oxidoreductase [unclassified Rhodococcus (in: high G+C Gram-positive bacteria)]|uniref:LLM class F420-dependent oxidoreductase n=1 Tax=unclassified Rhodococcus (in: high G+C Gram-positive bacteria) TaxID=192944 RepID=UPI0016397E47|nr:MULTISPECIES: LLM class F420-dependent oxidoreductase [unclassified Rhodococcus (in: high G+C Gram-positive bacteria)]MBC2637669.1 LLM class F420-dependent oxidoreductase [Rhodococcus sp. 3A]MBC2897587.1 LLM class F420-dependent oxidoreductase [Rhodococcus sp. 4CII]